VEAMMTGIPIISSDIPMNLEAVTEGETALVHKLKDANDLAEKMQLMITNYSTMIAMGSRARALATEKFNIQTIARQYQDILEKAVLKN
jgi:glycosyltransferase involved in cell wall biosynthesis